MFQGSPKVPNTRRPTTRSRLFVIIAVVVVVSGLTGFALLDLVGGGQSSYPLKLKSYSWPVGEELYVFIFNNSSATVYLNGSSITFDGQPTHDSASGLGTNECLGTSYVIESGSVCYIELNVTAPSGTEHTVGITTVNGVKFSAVVVQGG